MILKKDRPIRSQSNILISNFSILIGSPCFLCFSIPSRKFWKSGIPSWNNLSIMDLENSNLNPDFKIQKKPSHWSKVSFFLAVSLFCLFFTKSNIWKSLKFPFGKTQKYGSYFSMFNSINSKKSPKFRLFNFTFFHFLSISINIIF